MDTRAIVQELQSLLEHTKIPIGELAKKSYVSLREVYYIKRDPRVVPFLSTVVRLLDTMGYELVLREKEKGGGERIDSLLHKDAPPSD
jgi:hypothetical protein